jgi:hypothetical protein
VRSARLVSVKSVSPAEKSRSGPQAAATDRGLRTLLVAGLARQAGLAPGAAELHRAEEELLALHGLLGAGRDALAGHLGLAGDQLLRLLETLALERLALDHAQRLLADGPSRAEAAELSRLLGLG